MRTKKILSVLLAIFLFATMFGMAGAFAEDAVEAAGEVSAQAAARTGWPTAVLLEDAAAYAGGWNQGLIQWTPFVKETKRNEKDEIVTKTDSFADYKKEGEALVKWTIVSAIQYVVKDDVETRVPVSLKIENTPEEAARNPVAVYQADTGSTIDLVVKQGLNEFYGEITATLTVTAPTLAIDGSTTTERKASEATMESAPITIFIRNPEKFKELIDKVQKILDKGSRYDEDFIKRVQAEVTIANLYYRSYPSEGSIKINETVATLENILTEAPAHILFSRADWLQWLNNMFSNGFISFIWGAVDVFSFIGKIFSVTGPMWKAIGSFFGALLKIFNWITPLFALFGA